LKKECSGSRPDSPALSTPSRVIGEAVLTFRGVVKRFGGTVAVDDVDLDVRSGEVLALLGENGAGKSTIIKILAGVHKADAGEIRLGGEVLGSAGAGSRIAFIHQDLGLIEWMTAAENVAFVSGYERRTGRLIDWKGTARKAERILDVVGGDIPADAPISDLSRTDRSLVAIARALALQADVLVLDEPTASLPIVEVERLFEVLRGLKASGVAIVFVTHRLDEVFKLADRTAVMRDGRLVGVRDIADTDTDELIELIVGRRPQARERSGAPRGTATVLEAIDLCSGSAGPASFQIMAGEMVAFTGLRGAGQDVIARALAGIRQVTGGVMVLQGRQVQFGSAIEAIEAGCSFVTSNRQEEGLGMDLTVRENLFLNPALFSRRLYDFQRKGTERRRAAEIVRQFSVRPNDPERVISTLSGGNQQKVVLARLMQNAPPLIVLEEPTIGVDVGAKTEIYALLEQARARGHAMVLVSTDFEEVTKNCSRALVFNRGRVVRELRDEELTTQALIRHASAETTPATGGKQ
jgi:ribose transport system ATP-binding protein